MSLSSPRTSSVGTLMFATSRQPSSGRNSFARIRRIAQRAVVTIREAAVFAAHQRIFDAVPQLIVGRNRIVGARTRIGFVDRDEHVAAHDAGLNALEAFDIELRRDVDDDEFGECAAGRLPAYPIDTRPPIDSPSSAKSLRAQAR